MSRVEVRKTHKLYIGGAFPRSESGRTYEAVDAKGRFLANMAKASRKDGRDAVLAARKAFGGWSTRTPYNRGQILYRIAEVMEGRRDQLTTQLREAEGLSPKRTEAVVDAAVDRVVWYAGWADKYAQVLGNANPVSGPFFNLSSPEPTGVVAIVAPQGGGAGPRAADGQGPLLGLVSTVLPAITTGNTVVVVASEAHPIPAVTLAEIMATSDLPSGVVNLLTGSSAEIAPWLATHSDVNGLDLTGVDDPELARTLESDGAENLKRVRRPSDEDWLREPTLSRLEQWVETKTVWHPIGV
ncbi:aldehyde dehydrogenase family protein [Aeromicrobium terrae]|uniref:Aldehyde dehydrogenase n=1 Tax=Aeromicrobium terrae TaxID=2498846 RepID=A0A5C8NGP2_9ACTN|nr:aldehyde dehydrogenase family protein [Aeromicrobium terrae]TXL57306.1 aldehyde dehydrogenase [Aeromicrobium terrae]